MCDFDARKEKIKVTNHVKSKSILSHLVPHPCTYTYVASSVIMFASL